MALALILTACIGLSQVVDLPAMVDWRSFAERHRVSSFDASGESVCIGAAGDLDQADRFELRKILRDLGPQRKGPFEIFGERIQASWQSDIKWRRVQALLGDLRGQDVADIGANNGFYMYKLASAGVASVLGLEPAEAPLQSYRFFEALHSPPGVTMLASGYEALVDFRERFDLILCMGVIYHHRDPLAILRLCHGALRRGGRLLVETLSIPAGHAAHPIALIPAKSFAGMSGVWSVPNPAAVGNWLRRSGFREEHFHGEYEYLDEHPGCAGLPGLAQGLNESQSATIEGYPAPRRSYFTARR